MNKPFTIMQPISLKIGLEIKFPKVGGAKIQIFYQGNIQFPASSLSLTPSQIPAPIVMHGLAFSYFTRTKFHLSKGIWWKNLLYCLVVKVDGLLSGVSKLTALRTKNTRMGHQATFS